MANPGVMIAIALGGCLCLVVLTVIVWYFMNQEGSPAQALGGTLPSGTPPLRTPPSGPPPSGTSVSGSPDLTSLGSTLDSAATITTPPTTTPPSGTPPATPCPSGQWSPSGTTPCTQCSEPTPTQYVTAICTSSQNTQVAPIACPAGSATQDFDTGSSSRLGSRTCLQNVSATTPPPGQACPAGEQIVNGVCRVCPPGYNYNSLINECYAEI